MYSGPKKSHLKNVTLPPTLHKPVQYGSVCLTRHLRFLMLCVCMFHPDTNTHAPPQQECNALFKFINSHQLTRGESNHIRQLRTQTTIMQTLRTPTSLTGFTQIRPTGKLVLIQQRSLHTKEWQRCTTGSGLSQNHCGNIAFITCNAPAGNQN